MHRRFWHRRNDLLARARTLLARAWAAAYNAGFPKSTRVGGLTCPFFLLGSFQVLPTNLPDGLLVRSQPSQTRRPRPPRQPGATARAPVAAGAASAPPSTAVARVVEGLGYDLVDVERAPRGLLRVTIDRLPGASYPGEPSEAVTVDDCERVTRQLQLALEVDGVDYARLEVSSPGLDRPLRRQADYERFVGQELNLALKLPFEGRKHWRGMLERAETGEDTGWRLVFDEGRGEQALDFKLDEVREARLVPVIDFKGRGGKSADGDKKHGGAPLGGAAGGRKR